MPIPSSSRRTSAIARCSRASAPQKGFDVRPEWGAGKLLFELFERTVESTLRGPVFVTQYPAEVSPLARCNDADPFYTDRFELFVGGRELANGFSELNDPEDQAARFRAQVDAKAQGDEEAMFYDADYIRALEYGMPPAGGSRHRHRPPRDAADQLPVDPRRVAVPAAEARDLIVA